MFTKKTTNRRKHATIEDSNGPRDDVCYKRRINPMFLEDIAEQPEHSNYRKRQCRRRIPFRNRCQLKSCLSKVYSNPFRYPTENSARSVVSDNIGAPDEVICSPSSTTLDEKELSDSSKLAQSFFNDPWVQEELMHENFKAKLLMSKYFGRKERLKPILNNELEHKALTLIKDTSEMLRRYHDVSFSEECFPKDSLYTSQSFGMYRKTTKTQINWCNGVVTDSSVHSSSENIQFVDTTYTLKGYNILYKNDSRNLENDLSAEEFVPKLSSKNVHDKIVSINDEDKEYRRWLKNNNFFKNTNFNGSSTCGMPRSTNTETSVYTLYRQSVDVPLNWKDAGDDLLGGVTYSYVEELILHEHVVLNEFLGFFMNFYHSNGFKKLGVRDRIYQLLFLVMCYYVIVFVNDSGLKDTIWPDITNK